MQKVCQKQQLIFLLNKFKIMASYPDPIGYDAIILWNSTVDPLYLRAFNTLDTSSEREYILVIRYDLMSHLTFALDR